MSWYYVDAGGNTQGPLNLNAMKGCYQQGKLKDQSFVWNGADVNQWTPLNKVPKLLNSLKPQNIPEPNPGPKTTGTTPTRRRGPPLGRSALLGAIRSGTSLRKAPKPVETQVGQPSPGTTQKKPGTKLSLQEQMALTLRRRKMGGGPKTNTSTKNVSAPKKTYDAPKRTTAPKTNNSAPKTSWRDKQNQRNNTGNITKTNSYGRNNTTNTTSNNSISNKNSSGDSRIDSIVEKLKTAEDWQLKAIEKLLS